MSSEQAPPLAPVTPPAQPAAPPFVDRRKWIHKQLDAVRILSQALSQHVTVDKLVAQALESALEVLKAEAGSVLLADPATQQLVFHHSIGKSPVPYGTAIPWDKGIAGDVFQTGKPAIINDVKSDSRHLNRIDSDTEFETRNMVTLPLKRWEGEAIGVLNVLNKREGGIFDDDVATLTVISAITAAAIEQARLFEEAKLAEVARLLGDIGHDIKNMLMPVVMGDEQRLYNAFYNLINNAIPEVPEGGSITVRGQVDPMSKSIIVSVSDTGRGMPPEVRESLFTAHAISRKPGGTGLGTKIVKDVVDAHGGTIMVESENGKGATFHLRLPIHPPSAKAQKSAAP
jgi:K+-sensing histidine kinase KdpD